MTIFFDGHDFQRLLMAAPDSAASGRYDHAYWSVQFAPGTSEALRQLATVHESMHMALNDSTAFGTLLHVYAALLRGGRSPDRHGRVLDALIRQCLDCHEGFATWVSLVMVGRGAEDIALLKDYPGYVLYFEAARHVLRGLDGPFVRTCAANAAFRLCMQGTELDAALQSGLDRFDPDTLPAHAQPDRRLQALTGLAGAPFWQAAWEGLRAACHGHPEWTRLEEHQAGRLPFTNLLGREMDSLETDATVFFYDYLARALAQQGLPSLDFNGHQGFTARWVAALDRLYPDGGIDHPLVAAPSGPVDDEREQIERFTQERYRIRSEPFPATLHRIEELDGQPLAELLAGTETAPHLFVVVRQGLWLLQNYRFDPETEALLTARRHDPLVMARRRVATEAGVRIDLVWLETPEELSALAASAGATPIYASLSLTSLAVERWATTWYARLKSLSRVSLLFDLSPFTHLSRWADADAFDIRYTFLNVASEDHRHVVLLCRAEDGHLPPLLAPCSEMTARAIGYHLDSAAAEGRRFISDNSLATKMSADLSVWLGHLLREETAFDFLGAQAVATEDMNHDGPDQ